MRYEKVPCVPGTRFGMWEVLAESGHATGKSRRWKCRCDCGTVEHVLVGNLRSGHSSGCRPCRARLSAEALRLARSGQRSPAPEGPPAEPALDPDLCRTLTDWAVRPHEAGQDDL